jgi:hypothetical protein
MAVQNMIIPAYSMIVANHEKGAGKKIYPSPGLMALRMKSPQDVKIAILAE